MGDLKWAWISFSFIVCLNAQNLRFLGEIDVSLPGFTNPFINKDVEDTAQRYNLLLASFNAIPFTEDALYGFQYIGEGLGDVASIEPEVLSDNLLWPREPSQMPEEVFGFPAVSAPDGFLVPFKNIGDVNVVNVTDWNNPTTYSIARPPGDIEEWFYHRVIWKDMNGDGLIDALTSRAQQLLISGEFISEFLWFEHPQGDPFAVTWQDHLIEENTADTMSVEITLEAEGIEYDVVFTVGYFSEVLKAFWSIDPNGLWDDNSEIQSIIIDATSGPDPNAEYRFFDIEIADINNDGNPDLLISVNSNVEGRLVVYEIPADFRVAENYVVHNIADGFIPNTFRQEVGSPGSAVSFYPQTDSTDDKPWIAISADDMGAAFVVSPDDSTDPKNWSYTKTLIVDDGYNEIIGRITAMDADGDGYSELFVPSYYRNKLYVYTYAPE